MRTVHVGLLYRDSVPTGLYNAILGFRMIFFFVASVAGQSEFQALRRTYSCHASPSSARAFGMTCHTVLICTAHITSMRQLLEL